MTLKLYITAIDSREDGSAVTIFEDFQRNYKSIDELRAFDLLSFDIADKIEEVQKINDQVTSPF